MPSLMHGVQTTKIKNKVQTLRGRHNAKPINEISSMLKLDHTLVNNVVYEMYQKGEVKRTRNLDYNNSSQYVYYIDAPQEIGFKQAIEEWQTNRQLLANTMSLCDKVHEVLKNTQETQLLKTEERLNLLKMSTTLLSIANRLAEDEHKKLN